MVKISLSVIFLGLATAFQVCCQPTGEIKSLSDCLFSDGSPRFSEIEDPLRSTLVPGNGDVSAADVHSCCEKVMGAGMYSYLAIEIAWYINEEKLLTKDDISGITEPCAMIRIPEKQRFLDIARAITKRLQEKSRLRR